jgi:diaphanous 1
VQTDEDETVQTECVKCLRVLLNTEVRPPLLLSFPTDSFQQIGFEQVLAHSTLITYISYCLFTTSHKLRSQVADVLAALCILSLQDGHSVVLAALSDFRVAHDEKFRFSYLVDSIRLRDSEGEEEEEGWWEYRTAAMSLINAITNSPEEVEERVMLRDEFGRRGLNEVMAVSSQSTFRG